MISTFKTIFRYNWEYKKSVIVNIFFVFLTALLSTVGNITYKYLIDELGASTLNSVIAILGIYLIINLSTDVFNTMSYYTLDKFLIPAIKNLRIDIFKHLHDLDVSFHENKQSGALISRIKRGDGAYFMINHDLMFALRLILKFLFFGITVAFVRIEFVLILIGTIVVDVIATYFLLKYNLKTRVAFNKEEDKITHVIVDNMINYDTVKYFAREEYEQNRIRTRYIPWINEIWNYSYSFRAIDITTGFISAIGGVLLMLLAIVYNYNGTITTGELVMTIGFIGSIFPGFQAIIYRLRSVIKSYVDLEKYVSILDYDILVKESLNANSLVIQNGNITFDNVSFKYEKRETIFTNFDLQIKSGESVAFVGESGAGKTTLTKLLLRFYDIQNGKIFIDGQDISKVTKKSLRESIGVVPQEPILFNDTINYNLGYGIDSPSLKAIKEAAKFANLSTFIESLPEKYDTLVGERGIKLSGGQKQRLAIARMFLASPPIIIFDEATSQLDSNSEKLIQDAFWKLAKNRTTLIIAHRLSTVMRADRIVVLDNGQIVQQGTHKELADIPGVYKTLWDIQKGDFVL